MRLGTAIERLVDNYKYASDKEWINDKVAWALYHTWKEADRKTESSSEKPNNCEDEPTQDQHVQRVEYVENDEKSRCRKCRHFKSEHHTPIASDGHYYTYMVCMASECIYEPKDEPQTERSSE